MFNTHSGKVGVEDEALRQLCAGGAISWIDLHFARLLARLSEGAGFSPEVELAAALVSANTRQGHICLDLGKLSETGLPGQAPAESFPLDLPGRPASAFPPDAQTPMFFPSGPAWREKLLASGVVGGPGDYKPLIVDERGRLYLYRYWEYQHKLAEGLRERIVEPPAFSGTGGLEEQLGRLFPESGGGEADWQKIAAFAAVRKNFCVVSGGPGTGKTTTVIKILALLLERAHPGKPRIALAAPTGKAAARLQEAIKSARGRLDCSEWIKEAIPGSASTLHRLLGSVQGSPYFKYNADNPLPVDVMVVDEASMVDLALMAKLVMALPPRARLILLGDKDQLSSVEAGAVLGDICDTGEARAPSREFAEACEALCQCPLGLDPAGGANEAGDCIIELRRSYRFPADSGIGGLSQAVRDRNPDGALAILKSGTCSDLRRHDWGPSGSGPPPGALRDEVVEGFRSYWEIVADSEVRENSPEALQEVFDRFNDFRILCAVRMGSRGVGALNALVEDALDARGVARRDRPWYPGKPVMVLRNDYNLRLFNGDVGIYLPRAAGGTPDFRVFFPGREGRFRHFHPARLPEHETVYAMTVHKSQGSEFGNVLFVLPDGDSRVLTRELVYTAITRARRRLSIWGSETTLKAGLRGSTTRLSGLSDALWRGTPKG